jgi:hypothetical protein
MSRLFDGGIKSRFAARGRMAADLGRTALENVIIVLGMHRSGTSLVAELVHRWGAYAGEEQSLLPADEWNEQGYWEYMPLVWFNDELLAGVAANWLVPPGDEDNNRLVERAREPALRDEALRLLQTMNSRANIWFWKDPRLGLVLPFWKNFWTSPIYIVTVRHPLDIARSLQRRFHLPLSASLLLWQSYMLSTLHHTRESRRVIFIEYEQLLRHPREQCVRLTAFLDEQCGLPAGRGDIEMLTQGVKPNLKHNDSAVPLDEVSIAAPAQVKLYDFLRRRVENPSEEFEEAAFSLFPGWREYLQICELLRQSLIHSQRLQAQLPSAEPLALSASNRLLLGL